MAGLPYAMAVMTVLSAVGMCIPATAEWFSVAGRLAGFLQYPNTFAVLLLVAELWLITSDRLRLPDYICLGILLFGLLFTGSRTVLVLAAAANAVALIANKNKKVRWISLGAIAAGVAAVLLYCLLADNLEVLGRYLNINLKESTFVGRLLYVADALPVIAEHPFGLGYLGYHSIQQSIQTGVYAVRFVHNDFVQILLDVGWVPCAAVIAALAATFCNRAVSLRVKLLLAVMLLHACFDFDLQFIGAFMVLLLLTSPTAKKTWVLRRSRTALTAVGAVLALGSLFFGAVLGLARFGATDAALTLYPPYTSAEVTALQQATEPAEMEEIADRILARNEYVAVAYSAKARAAYARGDFAAVIENQNAALSAAPFSYEAYCDYGYMLANGHSMYLQAGDTASAEVCETELLALARGVRMQQDRLSEWGAAIDDQPITVLPDDLAAYVRALQQEE